MSATISHVPLCHHFQNRAPNAMRHLRLWTSNYLSGSTTSITISTWSLHPVWVYHHPILKSLGASGWLGCCWKMVNCGDNRENRSDRIKRYEHRTSSEGAASHRAIVAQWWRKYTRRSSKLPSPSCRSARLSTLPPSQRGLSSRNYASSYHPHDKVSPNIDENGAFIALSRCS